MTGAWRLGWLLVLVLAGCGRYTIEGTVTDRRGEGLPGVSVQLEASDVQAVTDGVGQFRIRSAGSRATLVFAKSGYASTREVVNRPAGVREPASSVALWKLPPRAGVFAVRENDYGETTRVQPSRFYLAEGGTIRGTRRGPELVLDEPRPVLIFYQTPRYDALLSRLRPDERKLLGESSDESVWTESGTVKPAVEPIAGTDGRLLALRLEYDLEPGVYAVHWGGLESDSTLDTRAYLFEIVPPPPPPVVEAAVEEAAPPGSSEPAAELGILEPATGTATPPADSGIIGPPMEPAPDILEPVEDLESGQAPAAENPASGLVVAPLEELEELDPTPDAEAGDLPEAVEEPVLEVLEPGDPERE